MAVVCDTSTAAVNERTELWVAAASEMFVPLECTPQAHKDFHGRMRAGAIGSLRLCLLEVSPHTVRRTPRLAANTNGDQYKLSLMLGGEALVVQDRREALLRPGDFAIYDCSRPYTLVGGDPFRMLVCVLPRKIVGISPERISQVTATRVPGSTGIAWAMAPFLQRLAELADRDEVPPDELRIVESVVDLVESLCALALGDASAPRAHSRAELTLRIRAYIESHLGDSELTPTQIAAAHYLSKRYLHKLFEARGVGVSHWIRERRLERCRQDLADPNLREETVTSIGMRWGLTDPCHLSRLFRGAYGCSPTEYRRTCLARMSDMASESSGRTSPSPAVPAPPA
jgi:AraC-like DNA-binding protein